MAQRTTFYFFLHSDARCKANSSFRAYKWLIQKGTNTRSKQYEKVKHLVGQSLRHWQFSWPMLRLPTSPSYREGNEKNLLNIARTGWKDAYPYLCIHLFNCGQYSPLDSLKQVWMFNILWIVQPQPETGLNYTVYISINGNFVFWNAPQSNVPQLFSQVLVMYEMSSKLQF